jgi:2-C-methyl-D-erythritol 4-phosphate cytidylyltransferase
MATIKAFFAADMPKIDGIALALPRDRLAEVSNWALPAPHWCAKGGKTRQESVHAAISILPNEPASVVMIHDAVRPFPPAYAIAEAIATIAPTTDSAEWDGAVLAEASIDTLKKVDANSQVVATVPREEIYRAQTPQLALLSTWKKAYEWTKKNNFNGTDDVSILEAMGLRVRAIPSPSSNQKVTTTDDWARLAPHQA